MAPPASNESANSKQLLEGYSSSRTSSLCCVELLDVFPWCRPCLLSDILNAEPTATHEPQRRNEVRSQTFLLASPGSQLRDAGPWRFTKASEKLSLRAPSPKSFTKSSDFLGYLVMRVTTAMMMPMTRLQMMKR